MQATLTKSGKYRAKGFNKYTKKCKSFTSESKKEAIRLATLYEMQVREDTPKGMTLSDGIDAYIESHKNIWTSERTATDYNGYKKCYGELCDRYLADLSDNVLQKWLNNFARNHSPKYCKNVFSLIVSVKTIYTATRVIKVSRPKVRKAILKLPSENDVVRYLAMAEETESDIGMTIPAYLSVFCAMRRGEICGLSTRDIDFDEQTITIRHSMSMTKTKEWKLKCTKNGAERKIHPPRIVFDKIKEYGLPYLNPYQVTRRHIKLRKLCGGEYRLHDLRHYCAARMLSMGCPIADVQEYGGWEDKNVLLDIYNYVVAESRTKSAQIWNDYADNLALEINKNGLLMDTTIKSP